MLLRLNIAGIDRCIDTAKVKYSRIIDAAETCCCQNRSSPPCCYNQIQSKSHRVLEAVLLRWRAEIGSRVLPKLTVAEINLRRDDAKMDSITTAGCAAIKCCL